MESRRKFIKEVAVSAVGLPIVMPITDTLNALGLSTEGPTLRVAIMGLGSYANRVAEAMKECSRARLVGAISGTPDKLLSWQAKYGIPKSNCYNYETYDEIVNNTDIDAVYITTPNGLHCEGAKRVAAAGKHVIVEKPMAVNATEGQEMVDACKAAGVHLLVGYRMHFEPKTLEVVQMRKAGDFGKIMFFQGQSGFRIGDPNQWRLNHALSGGGAMMDIGVYSINGARYMTGEEPNWVTAQETKTDPLKFKEGIDETIQFQMGFPSGAVASCLSTYNMNYLDRFYLLGQDGFAEMKPSTGYGPIEGRTNRGPLTAAHVTHQTLQMDAMARIILDGEKPEIPVNGEEGVKDMKIIEAIYRAVKTGSRVDLQPRG
jgi:predicted dehydrogenase